MSEREERTKYVAMDLVTGNVAFACFNIFRYTLTQGYADLWDYLLSGKLLLEQALVPVAMLGIYWCSGFYNHPFGKSRLQELLTTVCSGLLNTAIIYLVLLINDQTGDRAVNYEQIAVLFGLVTAIPYAGRYIVSQIAREHFKRGAWRYRVLIVGTSDAALAMGHKLGASNASVSYEVVGYLAADSERPHPGCVPLYSLEEVGEVCRAQRVDQLVLVPKAHDENKILEILDKLFFLDLPIKIAPDTMSYVTASIRMLDIYGEPFVDLTSPAMSESSKNMKRLSDVAVSLLALILLSPLYAVLAAWVKRSSKGPVFYRQERIGRHRRPFMIVKFRTMRTDAEADGPRLSADNDPRVTKAGRVMRKYRLDELPQFWNVLKGEMSIVGPRPEREYYIERILREAPYYTLVYQVRPGITSWGMVKYGYASTIAEMVARTRYDLIYMGNMSLFVDVKIMIYTIKTVVTGRGK